MLVANGSQLFDGCPVFIVGERAILLGRFSRQNRRSVCQHDGFLSFVSSLISERAHAESAPAPDGPPDESPVQ